MLRRFPAERQADVQATARAIELACRYNRTPSVTPDKQRVDLYGFASMLLAAVQSQAEQINDLRAHVDALEERLTTCVSPEPAPLSCQP